MRKYVYTCDACDKQTEFQWNEYPGEKYHEATLKAGNMTWNFVLCDKCTRENGKSFFKSFWNRLLKGNL